MIFIILFSSKKKICYFCDLCSPGYWSLISSMMDLFSFRSFYEYSLISFCGEKDNQFCFNIYGNVASSLIEICVSCYQFVFVIRTKYCYSAFVIAKGGEKGGAFQFLFPFIFVFWCAVPFLQWYYVIFLYFEILKYSVSFAFIL